MIVALWLAGAGMLLGAADPPQVEISNGRIKAKLYLPDARNGFYRGTRFDWSGVFASLTYKGHEFYGAWFDATDRTVRDFTYDGSRIVAGPCTAILGPAEEFQIPLGYGEAKPGEAFVKIGVGALRRPDDSPYSAFRLYEIVNPGKWTVRRRGDRVQFTHELPVAGSPFAYVYRKTVRLTPGKPQMVMEHVLRNTGKAPIRSNVYGHNFLALDSQPPGPEFEITLPFEIKTTRPPDADFARISGNRFVYLKELKDQDRVSASLEGFGGEPADHDIRIENRKVRAGVRITGNRPLSRMVLWSIRSVLSVEPFIDLSVQPGAEFTWTVTYDYYTLPR
jgi:hypothetical protein